MKMRLPKAGDWPGSWQKVKILRAGFEPATYGYLMFDQLQSTALPTELSKGLYWGGDNFISWLDLAA